MSTPEHDLIETAIYRLKMFIGKTRTELQQTAPWLKNRPKMLDCAAGYSWATKGQDIISCHIIRDKMIENKTWTPYKPGLIPVRGQAVIFDWNGEHQDTAHIGIVTHADQNRVTYISADSGEHQIVNVHNVGYTYVTGFGWYNLKPTPKESTKK
jgi:hypothetical protein